MSDKFIVKQIEELLLNELQSGPLERSTLIDKVVIAKPEVNRNTVNGVISTLHQKDMIIAVERGVWALQGNQADIRKLEDDSEISDHKLIGEEHFYDSFAEWLQEMDYCSNASALGKNYLKDFWATPDVIGIEKVSDRSIYRRSDIVAFISVEIKTSHVKNDIIIGFGQSCAYLQFSHRVYLALPKSVSAKNKNRIESLCKIVGLGLVQFDATNIENPNYQIMTQPLHREPDITALNFVLEKDVVYSKLIKTV